MKKVLLINGSPHAEGCVNRALTEVAQTLMAEGVETEIFHIGNDIQRGCIGCGGCRKTGKCVFGGEVYEALREKMSAADGVIVGSPVYYAGPNGSLCALLDRLFFSQAEAFQGKPAAAVVNCRRGGASAAFDRLNKYFTINCMPLVPSQYWNATHGNTPAEVERDEEGLQIMRTLGRNMAWLLKNPEKLPELEPRRVTNFIR